uniref:Uncharacterized protein n=1 Tax=Anguilla anguilla TaxID=7936 RepID=A0A0E9UTR7_ANGAN
MGGTHCSTNQKPRSVVNHSKLHAV